MIHVLSVLLATVAIFMEDGWGDGKPLLDSVALVFVFFADSFAKDPKTTVLVAVGVALLIELGFVTLAYVVMPWGACDEPLKASFRHALRRVWLQTPQVPLLIVVAGILAVPLLHADQAWRSSYPVAMPDQPSLPAPTPPQDAPPESQAWVDYEQAWQEYNETWQAHWSEMEQWDAASRRGQPWYLRFNEAIIVNAIFLSSWWLLWALLRSVGAARFAPPIERPPRCDACGYNLMTIPLESRCPECGEPVAASLGPDARPGAPWQRRQDVGRFAAWRRSWGDALRDPVRFGRTLRLIAPGIDHKRFLVVHLPLVFLIGAISPSMMYLAVEGRSPIPKEIEFVIIAGPVFGTLCIIGAIAFSLLSAASVGVRFHIRERRNLLVGAVQIVCYLFPYLIAWQVFGAVTAISAVLLHKNDWFRGLTYPTGFGPEAPAFLLWFIPNFACTIWYWALVNRAMAGTRYANR